MLMNADAGSMPLANESVDIIFTSPPYNVGLSYNQYDDSISEEKYFHFAKNWTEEAFRVLKDTGRLYIVISDQLLFLYRKLCEDIGFRFVQILVWCKPNLSSGTRAMKGDWNQLLEHILLVRKGKRTPMLNGYSNTHGYFVIPTPQSNWKREERIHPAQFPIKLPFQILSRTPGNVILDPFCGSGSTCAAALRLGRQFIGFDMDFEYCQAADNRIRNMTGRNVVPGSQIALPIQ